MPIPLLVEVEVVEEMILCTTTPSFWNNALFARSSLLNGCADNWLLNIGAMNFGQSVRQRSRRERREREECLAIESQTALQKRDQVSCVS